MTLAKKGTRWDDTCKSKTLPSEPRPTLKCQVSYIIISQMRAPASIWKLRELVVSFHMGSALELVVNYS